MRTPLAGHGMAVTLPDRWEGRIYRRSTPTNDFTPANRAATMRTGRAPGAEGWLGDEHRAIMHLANFALPGNRGDYGSGALESMTFWQAFIALIEFGPECLGTALYAEQGIPRTHPKQFDPNGLQRRIVGQSGFQRFFTVAGRPMCLFVVLGAHLNAARMSKQVNLVLDQVKVDPR